MQRTGIRERRHAPPEMATSDLAVEAPRAMHRRPGISAADIDLMVVGTFTPDLAAPSTAGLVQDRLGLRWRDRHPGGLCRLHVFARHRHAVRRHRLQPDALVIGADCNSRIVDPLDDKIYPLFGDGAGAVLLAAGSPEQGLLAYTLGPTARAPTALSADGRLAEPAPRQHRRIEPAFPAHGRQAPSSNGRPCARAQH